MHASKAYRASNTRSILGNRLQVHSYQSRDRPLDERRVAVRTNVVVALHDDIAQEVDMRRAVASLAKERERVTAQRARAGILRDTHGTP